MIIMMRHMKNIIRGKKLNFILCTLSFMLLWHQVTWAHYYSIRPVSFADRQDTTVRPREFEMVRYSDLHRNSPRQYAFLRWYYHLSRAHGDDRRPNMVHRSVIDRGIKRQGSEPIAWNDIRAYQSDWIILFDGKTPFAFLKFFRTAPNTIELDQIWVDQEDRREGYGTLLLSTFFSIMDDEFDISQPRTVRFKIDRPHLRTTAALFWDIRINLFPDYTIRPDDGEYTVRTCPANKRFGVAQAPAVRPDASHDRALATSI